jgi:hypothetical protein
VLNGGGAERLARGALAGAVAWWVMDQTLQTFYDRQSAVTRHRESEARNGVPALEVLAEELAASAGRPLSEEQRESGGTILQWTTGIGAGVIYAVLRDQLPGSGIGRGLGYGAVYSLLVDEGLIPLLGLAPGPGAFPWQTHARGFVGHLVFGMVAEAVLEALEARR